MCVVGLSDVANIIILCCAIFTFLRGNNIVYCITDCYNVLQCVSLIATPWITCTSTIDKKSDEKKQKIQLWGMFDDDDDISSTTVIV